MARNVFGEVKVRSGLSFARGVAIEQYLNEDEIDVLHERWKDEWPERLDFRGGVKSVTCEMIQEVSYQELSGTYGVRRAKRLVDIADKYAALT